MDRMDGLSMNIEKEARERLQSVFPECFSEGTLDIDKLLTMCGEYITNDFEKYKFEWNGKGDAMKLAQRRSAACLRPCIEESVNFDTTQNLYIEGDNLEVLKLLQTAYFRQVKMIYIDPPYNTGNDFVYEDDFKDPLAHYLEVTSQATKSNPETMGRFHTAWLNMMYPRLRLAANLLRDDGVIFISIDDNEVFNLKKLCDEVFGEENYVADFIWRKKSTSTNVVNAMVSTLNDHILCYSKSSEQCLNRRKTSVDSRNYSFNDKEGNYRTTIIEKKDAGDYARATMRFPILGILPRYGKRWQIGEKTAREYERKNRFINDNGIIKLKIYELEDTDTFSANPNLLLEYGSTDSANKSMNIDLFGTAELFSNPKPTELLKHLISIGTTSNDIILDFFSGSATTAHAVMQLNKEDGGNRRFICVQLPEVCDEKSEAYKAGYKNICEIGKERIRRAADKLKMENGKLKMEGNEQTSLDNNFQLSTFNFQFEDTGFKVFKLDSSNIKFWDGIPIGVGNGQMYFDKVRNVIDGVKDDRPALDVVYELMLKLGVPLTVAIEKKESMGKTVYSVDGDLLLFCLEPGITAEFIESLADLAPAKIIVAEMGFADDTAMANAHYILQDKGIEIKLV